jgi:hypothetical protein
LVIALCRLSNLPSGIVPPMVSTISSIESLRRSNSEPVAALDLALQLRILGPQFFVLADERLGLGLRLGRLTIGLTAPPSH